jgi:hypothetical protein
MEPLWYGALSLVRSYPKYTFRIAKRRKEQALSGILQEASPNPLVRQAQTIENISDRFDRMRTTSHTSKGAPTSFSSTTP